MVSGFHKDHSSIAWLGFIVSVYIDHERILTLNQFVLKSRASRKNLRRMSGTRDPSKRARIFLVPEM
jgi:hypothetical protein